MPSLRDLFNLRKLNYNDVVNAQPPPQWRNLPPPPREPEWDIRSGLPEPGLGQVTPEEWLPPGAGMKLASLAKGSAATMAAGIMKPKGGVWMRDSLPSFTRPEDFLPRMSGGVQQHFIDNASKEDIKRVLADFGGKLEDKWPIMEATRRHYKDPSYIPFMSNAPQVAAGRWAQGPLAKYITRDMATEGDPIRALAEEGITHLGSGQTKKMLSANKRFVVDSRLSQGFPSEEIANTRLGKIWERIADNSVVPGGKNEHGDTVFQYMNYGAFSPNSSNGLNRLVELIENGIQKRKISPGAASRGNFTVQDAVRYADAERKLAERNLASPDVFKEYPETGHRWVQLNKPGQFDAESDAMRNSVRGYEPTSAEGDFYGLGGFPAIESGKAKIFSLRDASGKPSVTVEIEALPDGSHRISQIKGRANTAPKPEYSQMIEDLKRQFGQ